MHNISVLVVDDSAFMRKSLSLMLESDERIKVVGTARNGEEGVILAKKLRPDIITLDVEMPVMDGLTALKKIMAEAPTSVIMVSSLTTEGAEATLTALELGAVDFIPKELSYVNINITKIKDDLISKVKEIYRQKFLKERLERVAKAAHSVKPKHTTTTKYEIPKIDFRAVSIGISTGGPISLQKVIPVLSENINVPIFVVQHMPPKFTKSLAERLNSISKLTVKEAENGEPIKDGVVYIAPGGYHMKVKKISNTHAAVEVTEEPKDSIHKPSVDVMINSVVDYYGKHTIGVIMTGMGKDGLEAIRYLKSVGGYSIAQDEETCVVYGMPRAIVEAGLADIVLPLEKIPELINKVICHA